MDAAEQTAELSFEAALARLEEIVRVLERGEAPLDKSIELYQEGDGLKRHCEARLKDAQARIEQIAFGADGKPAGVKPFDAN
jgi:exodeoxyribonuclease VII small subunit